MHVVRIAAYGLIAIGSIVGLGIVVSLLLVLLSAMSGGGALTINSQGGLRPLLAIAVVAVTLTSGIQLIKLKAEDTSTSALAVALVALLCLALDFYVHGKLYLTGDFGPIAAAMLICSVLLAASSDVYHQTRAQRVQSTRD